MENIYEDFSEYVRELFDYDNAAINNGLYDMRGIEDLCECLDNLVGPSSLSGQGKFCDGFNETLQNIRELHGFEMDTTDDPHIAKLEELAVELMDIKPSIVRDPAYWYRQPKTYLVDPERFEDKKLKSAAVRFRRSVMLISILSCVSCTRIGNKTSIRLYDISEYCQICEEVLPVSKYNKDVRKVYLCECCWKAIKKEETPATSLANRMDCAKIPPEMIMLNSFEKLLLAKNRACQTIVKLGKGRQLGCRGLCIQFPSDVSKFVDSLPDNQVLVFRDSQFVRKGLPVRVRMILAAVNSLRMYNPLYSDISIDEKRFAYLFPDADEDNAGIMPVYDYLSFMPIDPLPSRPFDHGVVNFSADDLRLPGPPLDSFNYPSWESGAHPTLYPDGRNDFTEKRRVKLHFSTYLKARLLQEDPRFRDSIPWLFHMVSQASTRMLRSQSGVYTRMINQAYPTKEEYLLESVNIASMKNFMHVQQIRGTEPYWAKVLQEVLARCAMWGQPTFFVTFSANDVGWPDVFHEILRTEDEDITAGLSYAEREDLLRRNPVIVMKHLEKRFRAILAFILDDKIQVIGRVVHYFVRAEFQMRGSVHYHCIFWCADAPNPENSAERQAVVSFIDKYITVEVPDEGEDKVLYDLVTCLQQHYCSKCCRKSGGKYCRFGAPFKVSNRTEIVDLRSKKSQRHFYQLRRGAKETLTNPYNPVLLLVWGGNMDIQMIRGATGLAMYLFAYLTKSEPVDRSMLRQEIEMALEKSSNTAARRIFYKTGLAFLRMRSLSAQEAALQGLQLPYCYSDVTVLFVDTNRVGKRMFFFKPHKDIECLEAGSRSTIVPTKWEKYVCRPDNLEDVCQAKFFSQFEFLKVDQYEKRVKRYASGKKELPLHGRMRAPFDGTFVMKRSSPICVRFRPLPADEADLAYHYMSAFLAHRSEEELGDTDERTIEAFYSARSSGRLQFDTLPSLQFQEEISRSIESVRLKAAADVAGLIRCVELAEDDSSDDGVGEFVYDYENDLRDFDIDDCGHGKIQESNLNMLQYTVPPNWMENILKMNKYQREAMDYVMGLRREGRQLTMFVTGGAGSGKSFWVDNIRNYLGAAENGRNVVATAAPTGVAAHNIRGMTIHSLLGIYPDKKSGKQMGKSSKLVSISPLSDEKVKKKRREFSAIKYLVVDEVSMVTPSLLLSISERLQQIRNNQQPFGGMNVIFLGDFYQLPPVCSPWIFESRNVIIQGLWRSFVTFFFDQNERQRGDSAYLKMLNVIRTGHMTMEIVRFLVSRQNRHGMDPKYWSDATHIYELNKDVDRENAAKLTRISGSSVVYHAKDTLISRKGVGGSKLIYDDVNKCGGLAAKVVLKISAKVMVLRNINLEDGIYNGALGTIVSLPEDRTGVIGVLMENRESGRLSGRRNPDGLGYIVYVEHVMAQFPGRKGTHWKREQYPIRLCYAVTNYKCQGLTLGKIVVHVRSPKGVGILYTSLSRVPNSENLSVGELPLGVLYRMIVDGPSESFVAVKNEYDRLVESQTVSLGSKESRDDADNSAVERKGLRADRVVDAFEPEGHSGESNSSVEPKFTFEEDEPSTFDGMVMDDDVREMEDGSMLVENVKLHSEGVEKYKEAVLDYLAERCEDGADDLRLSELIGWMNSEGTDDDLQVTMHLSQIFIRLIKQMVEDGLLRFIIDDEVGNHTVVLAGTGEDEDTGWVYYAEVLNEDGE